MCDCCQDDSQPPTQADESGIAFQRTAATGQAWTARLFLRIRRSGFLAAISPAQSLTCASGPRWTHWTPGTRLRNRWGLGVPGPSQSTGGSSRSATVFVNRSVNGTRRDRLRRGDEHQRRRRPTAPPPGSGRMSETSRNAGDTCLMPHNPATTASLWLAERAVAADGRSISSPGPPVPSQFRRTVKDARTGEKS